MTADECITIMVERIVRNFQPLKIMLFGSRARGDAKPDSDIDLIIVFASIKDKYAMTIQIRRSLAGVGFAKDVIVTTPEEIEQMLQLPGHVFRYAIPESRLLYEHTVQE